MKHTKQNRGMSRRIMAFFLTVCMTATIFLPSVPAQAVEPTTPKVDANATVDTFDKLQAAIAAAPTNGTAYVIEVTKDFEITTCLKLHDKENITIRGDAPERKLTRKVNGNYLFSVAGTASLTLESIVIDGNKAEYDSNTLTMIIVQGTAKLALNKGTVLQNNKATNQGGAVYIGDSSTFSMSEAKILNNDGRQTGGIVIVEKSTISSIDIANSVISGNTTGGSGGGLCSFAKNAFTLNMINSQIINNTAAGYGGGIYVGQNAKVTMDGGSQINGNKSGTNYHGGAIYAADNFTLDMSGASQINGNTSLKEGGGIYCTDKASFSIKDGSQINGNVAGTHGGGICNATSITNFLLDGSEICGNTAGSSGGGVYAAANGFPLAVTGSSKINGNAATGGYGGGIAVVSKPFPENTIVRFEGNSEIVGNSAKYAGAFWLGNTIHDNPYTMYIQDTVKLQNNTAEDTGGAYIRGGNVIVSTTTPISGNKNTSPTKGSAAINVDSGTLTLKNGVSVTENTGGTPILVTNKSTLTMESGSSVSNNESANSGGGLRLNYGCTLDMKAGSVVSGNKVTNGGGGGGIYLYASGGTIAGEVSGNTAADNGGGIYIHGFVKSYQPVDGPKIYIVVGAKIQNNTALSGGGIYVNGEKSADTKDPRAVLYVQGGEITGNTAKGTGGLWGYDSGGGGIAVARAQAEISGGKITGNTAKKGAGGVETLQQLSSYIGSGKLTISGGDISGNTSNKISDRTALNIQARSGGEIILTKTFTNPQSLKVDTGCTLTLENNSTITTQGNVTIGKNYKLITIDPNEGTVTGMVNFIEGDNVVLPPASVLNGKPFAGWQDGTKFFNPRETVPISKTVTYKAAMKYDVTYTAGKDATGTDKTDIKYSDIDLALLGETFKKAKNVQSGWSLTDGGEKAYDLGAKYTGNADLVLYPVWSPAGDVDVTVKDEDGNPLVAKVKITQAEQTVPNGTERASDENGKVTFSDLPYGIYNVVVTYTSGKTTIVVTKAIEINNTSLSVSVTLPNVRLNTEVKGTIPVAVEDLESAITEAEKSEITDNTTPGSTSEIRIVLDATPEDNTTITDAIKADAGADKTLTNYVDVTVTKTLTTIDAAGTETAGTPEELKTTAEYQTLSFAILPELAAALAAQTDATVDNVLVYRRHVDDAGTATITSLPKVSAQYGKTAQYDCYYIETVMGIPYIVVRSKNFSTYAFGLQATEIDKFNPYIITFDATGGNVTPTTAAANISNKLDTLPIPTRSGYRFDGWFTTADGGDEVTTSTPFSEDSTIYAHWTYQGIPGDYYTITATSNAGGTIAPTGSVWVVEKTDKTFTITPDKGFIVDDVLIDGVSVGAVSSYTFKNIQKNHTINVIFKDRAGAIELDKVNHFAYMMGYPTGDFAPNRNMTRAEAIVMFSRLLLQKMDTDKNYSSNFSDISGGEWYANAVGYMERFGIISGYPDGTFGGDKPVTRAEFAAIAARFDELLLDKPNPFSDVASTHWARDFIASASNKGWVSGYPDGTFKPENYITRAEVVTIVNRMLNRKADVAFVNAHKDAVKYTDLQNDQDWYYYNIAEASIGHKYERSADGTELWTSIQK